MKIKIVFFLLFLCGISFSDYVFAEKQKREVPSFSEISLRVSGTLHVKQGDNQHVEIVAKPSTIDEIVTEVRGRTLNIRLKSRNLFLSSFDPGKIEIFVTVPEITALSVLGTGDIVADSEIDSRIIDLSVSGSGNVYLDRLDAQRVKATVSGSGDIMINDGQAAEDFIALISGSGNIKAERYEAANVDVKIVGSGNCSVYSNGFLKARVAGSGNVYYYGNPSIDTSVLGSGSIEKR